MGIENSLNFYVVDVALVDLADLANQDSSLGTRLSIEGYRAGPEAREGITDHLELMEGLHDRIRVDDPIVVERAMEKGARVYRIYIVVTCGCRTWADIIFSSELDSILAVASLFRSLPASRVSLCALSSSSSVVR
jgi:hypothetical protein